MGKGGMSRGNGEEENMAAWLLGVNNLKILPFKLPLLGILVFFCPFSDLFLCFFSLKL